MNNNIHANEGLPFYCRRATPSFWQNKLQLYLAMKLFLIFLTLSLQVSAAAYSQAITLSVKKAPFREVMQSIREQTGYAFIIKSGDLKQAKPVTVTTNKAPLEETLKLIFSNQPFTYEVVDKAILIQPKNKKKEIVSTSLLIGDSDTTKSIIIYGTITDRQKMPLAGVGIRIKGTTSGTATDLNGNYTLTLKSPAVLIFSYIGFQTLEVKVNKEARLDFVLNEITSLLKEVSVVSTGYQNIPKERATGSFTKIDNETFNRNTGTNVIDRLEGVTSGLSFNKNQFQGEANTSSISIRGLSTIFANQKPLIVVDNFAFDGDIGLLNPNDVESVTILKDAAAASIWGARSGNGVIVITTKKGTLNKPLQISLNANFTYLSKPNLKYGMNFMNSSDYIDAETFLFNKGQYDQDLSNTTNRPLISPVVELLEKVRSGTMGKAQADQMIDSYRNMDYRKDLSKYFYRNTVSQQYAVNINGGGQNSSYYVSAGFDKVPSNLMANSYNRLNLTTAYNFTPIKNLEISTSITFAQTDAKNGNQGLLNPNSGKSGYYPYLRMTDDNGNPISIPKNYRYSFIQSLGNSEVLDWTYNPIQEINIGNNVSKTLYTKINAGVKYTFIPGLSAEVKYQQERQKTDGANLQSQQSFYTRDLLNLYTQVSNGVVSRPIPLGDILDQSSENLNGKSFRAQLNLNKNFGNHDISAIGGIEAKEVILDQIQNRLYGYTQNGSGSNAVDYTTYFSNYQNLYYGGVIPYNSRIDKLTDEYFSYFMNASYTYLKRYTLSGSGRIDQSNLFGVKTNQKSVPLWSGGFAWDISQEGFYSVAWLPYLKLRATYGYNGNVDKSVSAYTTAIYAGSSNLTGAPIVYIQNPPNPELRWERIGLANFGLDFRSKNDLLSGSIEYYQKKGKDIIGFAPTDPTVGVSQYKGNVAGIKGQGVDVDLSLKVGNKLKWISNILYSRATDKVTSYDLKTTVGGYLQLSDGTLGVSGITPIVGMPVFSIISYKWAGLDPTNGDPQGYLDGHVSKDYAAMASKNTLEDVVLSGSARPTNFGSFRNTFTYKNISLSFNIGYKFGYYFRKPSINYSLLAQNWTMNSDFTNRWRIPGDEAHTNVPSFNFPVDYQRDVFYQYSETLVEKGDHIRLQDVSISYTFANLEKLHLKNLQVYGYANNLGIIWKATKANLDPDYLISPYVNPKTFSIGVRTTF